MSSFTIPEFYNRICDALVKISDDQRIESQEIEICKHLTEINMYVSMTEDDLYGSKPYNWQTMARYFYGDVMGKVVTLAYSKDYESVVDQLEHLVRLMDVNQRASSPRFIV